MKEMITIEKEVYEAVLRNSLRVTQMQIKKELIEAENIKLKGVLEECREYLYGRMHDSFIKYLLTKIDEVLK